MDSIMSQSPGFIKKAFLNRTVLVTGHSGFKGSWLVSLLNNLGAKTIGLSIDSPLDARHAYFELAVEKNVSKASQVNFDVGNLDEFEEAINAVRPDFIFHLAGQAIVSKSYVNPMGTFETNTLGVMNLLEILRRSRTSPTTVIVTSDKCYENDETGVPYSEVSRLGGYDPYSASKAAAELIYRSYVNAFNQSYRGGIATARAGNVFGGGDWSSDRLIPDLIRAALAGDQLSLRMPSATRPWTYVLDILWGYCHLAAALKLRECPSGESWNFASGERMTVLEVAEVIAKSFHTSIRIDEQKSIGREANQLQISPVKANTLLGWRPKEPVRNQIGKTLMWYQNQHQNLDVVEYSQDLLRDYTND